MKRLLKRLDLGKEEIIFILGVLVLVTVTVASLINLFTNGQTTEPDAIEKLINFFTK